MKKIGIITINDINNYGNRLQNYALQEYCKENFENEIFTLRNYDYSNDRQHYFLRQIKHIIYKRKVKNIISTERKKNFLKFEKKIKYYNKKITAFTNLNLFDYIIVGSDQVWNPYFRRLRDVDILKYVNPEKRISYAASFGVDKIPSKYIKKIKVEFPKFKAISVREFEGKQIIEENTNLTDVDVLIDPTMLLTEKEWLKVAEKPNMIKNEKFILCYFLGENSDKQKIIINDYAKKEGYNVINLLDKNDPFNSCGPSEFLWLEKNAELICTDSFHSCVFAIIFRRPFIVFDREQINMNKMNSRINTLLKKFDLLEKRFDGNSISKEKLNIDYTKTYEILEDERKKSLDFFVQAFRENRK
ncbi:MAG: polysaccharide pyruvyl transferase family protein [Firmicutes bacterium]|nr:polysaccharide pyruvyl transferase family protein [Bacillota bacterium]